MTEYQLDLRSFPPKLHRVVKAWYAWSAARLRARGTSPGSDDRNPATWETAEDVFWGGRPPKMTSENELTFIDDREISYHLVCAGDVYYIDKTSRGSRKRYWMFKRFDDAEKCVLYLISNFFRPGDPTNSIAFRWHQEGLDPRVSLSQPDPANFPGRVSLTVAQEAVDRGWMGRSDAIDFSHALLMDYEELDNALREGLPSDWFSSSFVAAD